MSKKINKLIKFKILIFLTAITTTLQTNTQFYRSNRNINNIASNRNRFSRSSKINSRTKTNSKCDISYYTSKLPRCSACCYYPYHSYQYYPYSNFTWWR